MFVDCLVCYRFILFSHSLLIILVFFFFQAEDGIRDVAVTGVQTCALPISFQHSTNYDGSYYNIDRRVAYGPNDDYRDHLFIFTQVYDLPFGHGKRWASNLGRAADLLIGGWSINSATVIGSGLPFTPHPDSCSTSSDTGPCRADVVGSVENGPRSGNPETAGC